MSDLPPIEELYKMKLKQIEAFIDGLKSELITTDKVLLDLTDHLKTRDPSVPFDYGKEVAPIIDAYNKKLGSVHSK